MSPANGENEFEAIEELLPWYATDALGANEKRRVEEALAREPRLRASLSAIREDLDETVALNQALGAPRPTALDRIMAVAGAEPRRPSLSARLFQWIERAATPIAHVATASPRGFAFAVFVAGAVVIGQGVAIFSLLPQGGLTYSTASQQETTAARDGVFLLVSFVPTADVDQIAEVLQQRKATIVDGPRGGLFRLRIGDKSMTKEERDAAIAAWRKEPIIRLALPAETH